MELSALINTVGIGNAPVEQEIQLTDIQSDSRKVRHGSLFVAVRGTAVDGHDYIEAALTQGAAAIVCEHKDTCANMPQAAHVLIIQVADSADALGRLASAWHGEPLQKPQLVCVTGSNG